MARSKCQEITMVEMIVYIIPKLSPEAEDDLPHPDIKNAYISPHGPDFLVNMWIYNFNPFHAAHPIQGLTTSSSFKVVNRGRKITTLGRVSISFDPHDLVLADRMTVRTKDKSSVNSVKVACHSDGRL